MKKHFLGFAALSLLLLAATSCTNETRESINDGDGALTFRAALGKQTRATEFTYWADGGSITVKSFVGSTTTPFNTFNLKYDASGGGSWSYTPVKHQPGYPLRYYSIYPALGVTNETVTAETYAFDYAVQPVATQTDLIGVALISQNEAVTLAFKHLLSQVNFAVQAIPGVKIEISNINVNDVKNTGTYTFENLITPADAAWSNLGGDGDYTYTAVVGAAAPLASGTSSDVIYLGNGGTTYNNTNALMLMPQTFAAQTDGTFSFDFSLTVDGNADGDFVDAEDTKKADNKSATVCFCNFDTQAWAPGKRYVYLIDFTSYLAGGPITFTVSVDQWVNDNDNTLAETIHVAKETVQSIEAAIALHATANKANTALKVFPISVANDITAAMEIKNIPATADAAFDSSDEIRIEFPNASSVSFVSIHADLTAANWGITTSGRVVTLKKN